MGETPATALIFADRQRGRVYPVTDPAGADVALISHHLGGARFVAEDPAGVKLCAGSASWWGMSNRWLATDSTGGALLELRKSTFRARAEVRLENGGDLVVHGSIWRRDFEVREGDQVVLSAVPQTAALSLRPYEFAVLRTPSDRLSLAEVVAIVQIWRLIRKRDDASSAASTVVVASG